MIPLGMSSHKITPGDASILYQGSMAIGIAAGYVDISAAASTTNVGAFWGTFYIDPTTLKPTFKKLLSRRSHSTIKWCSGSFCL